MDNELIEARARDYAHAYTGEPAPSSHAGYHNPRGDIPQEAAPS